MKRLLLFAVLIVFSAALALAGGQGEAGTTGTGPQVNPPGTYPIVDTKVSVDVMTRYGAVESDGNYQDAAFTEWYEDLTNVHMNFVDIVESQAWQERLNLVLASGDLPDTLMVQGVMGGQEVFINGVYGNFMAVDDLIDEWMPALKATLAQHPEQAKQIVMPDGNMYSFPSYEGTCYHCTMSRKMWVFTPWLDELGLDVPVTTEEFYQMLLAFKNQDPNGNGRADEIAMAGSATGGWNADPLVEYLMSSFIYTDPANFLRRTGGSVDFVANTPEWRDGVRYMAKLYEDGLMLPDWFTQGADQLRAAVENPDAALVGAVPAGWYGVFSINGWDGSGRFADFQPIAPLAGPTGLRQSVYSPQAVSHHTVISADSDKGPVIARLNDWFYESIENREIGNNWYWPEEDYRWLTDEEKAEGRLLARDFSVADYVLITEQTYGEDRFWHGWRRLAPAWSAGGGNAMPPEWAEDPTKQEWRLAEATRDLYEPYKPDHNMPPNLIVADEVQDELADLQQLIIGTSSAPGLVATFYAEFVTGARDINNNGEWDAYVAELDRAGADRYVEIMQQTLTSAGY